MSNSDLDQAREWAMRWEDGSEENDPFIAREELAVIKLIKSLPDQWVDIEKVQEVIEEMKDPWGLPKTTDLEIGADMATEAWRRRLETLMTPKPPTLADMTPEEREACQWMQCKIDGHNEPQVLSKVGQEYSWILLRNGNHLLNRNEFITPLTGEPKLKWPGSEVPEPPALPEGMRLADHPDYGRVLVSPEMDSEGDYKAFHADPGSLHGADWEYVHERNLTFLDGEK